MPTERSADRRRAGHEVASVRTVTIALPLPRPLVLGPMTVARREYTLLEVRTVDGLRGKAYCLSREAPMAELVDRLITPHVRGQEIIDVPALWRRALRGSAIVGRVGLVRRALGLVDVALWDVRAQLAQRPLWQMLEQGNGGRDTMMVAAYPTLERDVDDVASEVIRQADRGWPLLKISRLADPSYMRRLLARIGDSIDVSRRLVVDAGFGWDTADDALAELAEWGSPELAWLEDPLLPEDVEGCAKIRSDSGMRIGVGDEVTDPVLMDRLILANALDVVRLDLIALGGITPALSLLARAQEAGLPVSCHVYPEVAVHLDAGIETFDRSPEGNPYDPSPSLVTGGPRFESGKAHPPSTAGLGFDLPDLNAHGRAEGQQPDSLEKGLL